MGHPHEIFDIADGLKNIQTASGIFRKFLIKTIKPNDISLCLCAVVRPYDVIEGFIYLEILEFRTAAPRGRYTDRYPASAIERFSARGGRANWLLLAVVAATGQVVAEHPVALRHLAAPHPGARPVDDLRHALEPVGLCWHGYVGHDGLGRSAL
jgi:hypothetical protein